MKFIVLAFLTLAAAGLYNYSVETLGVPSSHGFLGRNSADFHFLFLVALMLIGITFGSLYRQLRTDDEFSGPINAIRKMFKGRDFFLSVLVSPIVFWGFYQATKENPLSASSLFIAFQNGFFCQAIFEKSSANQG